MGFDLDAIPYLAASRSGTRIGTPRLVVIHAMANAGGIRQGAAQACAQWFANPDCLYQAHLSVDPREVWRSVPLTREAYHVGRANIYGGNPSVGIELAGYGDDRDDWSSADGYDEVSLAAQVAHAVCNRFGIPWKWLADDELRTGMAGVSDHETCARVLGGSDHTDPGRKFPRDLFMALGAGAAAPQEDIEMTRDELIAVLEANNEKQAARTRDYLANPEVNPGTVVAPNITQALASIQTAVVDPENGIRALLAAGKGQNATVDVEAVARAITESLGADLAGQVVDEIGRQLAPKG